MLEVEVRKDAIPCTGLEPNQEDDVVVGELNSTARSCATFFAASSLETAR
ncbi:hypothetical protein [Arthrobacter sp. efr-133-R2A-63]|nr:hypothetical protein [Arthrobacter sp. efr-133-R2A-63]